MNVLIVDDHEIVRDGLSMLLKDAFSIQSFAFASDGREAIQQSTSFHFDLILMDLSMPGGLGGLHTLPEVRKLLPKAKIVIFSMFDEIEYQRKAFEMGADGFLVKQLKSEQLIHSLSEILKGKKVFDQQIFENTTDSNIWENPLSAREEEVFILTLKGYSQKDIAEMLSISIKTVENHRRNISNKLGSKNKHDWMDFAQKYKLLDLY